MKNSSTISSKGQVTVPQEIRARLGLSAGDRVEFVVEGERTLIRPARSVSSPFDRYRGLLNTFPGGAAEINSGVGEMRDEDGANQRRRRR